MYGEVTAGEVLFERRRRGQRDRVLEYTEAISAEIDFNADKNRLSVELRRKIGTASQR
jgi:hypothetical protein